jgi:hypothetical protein
MTLEELQELNTRRRMLIDNIDFFKANYYRLQTRIHEMEEQIVESEILLESLTNIFFNLTASSQPKVTPLNCVDNHGESTIMLKIEIEGQDPIYKCLHRLEYEFFGDTDTLTGQLRLRDRFNEIAIDFIKSTYEKGSLNRAFEKESVDFHLSPERYIKSTLSKKKLQSRNL